jgi:hypothetical protein
MGAGGHNQHTELRTREHPNTDREGGRAIGRSPGQPMLRGPGRGRQANFDDLWIGEPNSGCWLWVGSVNFDSRGDRYGRRVHEGRFWRAHRLSFVLHRGPIPDGLWVLHRCDTPLCVNPQHLFLGTVTDNNADMTQKGRRRSAEGEAAGNSKLTAEQVVEIRTSPGSHANIAARFGVSPTTIGRIQNGEGWRSVP